LAPRPANGGNASPFTVTRQGAQPGGAGHLSVKAAAVANPSRQASYPSWRDGGACFARTARSDSKALFAILIYCLRVPCPCVRVPENAAQSGPGTLIRGGGSLKRSIMGERRVALFKNNSRAAFCSRIWRISHSTMPMPANKATSPTITERTPFPVIPAAPHRVSSFWPIEIRHV
jgi:hypothetical protein